MKNKIYSVELQAATLLAELENFFRIKGHQVQTVPISGGQILQALKESTLSALTGQSSALTIKVMPVVQGTMVEIGSSKWIDKAAAGVIGYVLLPPLILFPLIGMYNQMKLAEEAWRIIDSFAARAQSGNYPPGYAPGYPPPGYAPGYAPGYTGGQNPGGYAGQNPGYTPGSWAGGQTQQPTGQTCINCRSWLTPGSSFCSGCGSQVNSTASAPICKKCGTTNLRGARFCSSCGDKFE